MVFKVPIEKDGYSGSSALLSRSLLRKVMGNLLAVTILLNQRRND